jgi:UV DNA damage endonuclease
MICHRLGFPVKVVGAPLRSHDTRRWQSSPHLSVSLAYLRDIFGYLQANAIQFYRVAAQLAPYLTHPSMPQFHNQLDESAAELTAIGELARQAGLRLTMHPTHYVQMSSPSEATSASARTELAVAAAIFERMGLDHDAVIVVHVGGVYGDPSSGCERFVRQYERLPQAVRDRLVLENDDHKYSLEDCLWIHERTGVPLVLDVLHLRCLNPGGRTVQDALTTALATWPLERKPKIHFSSPRTSPRIVERDGKEQWQAPLPNQHSDFLDPFTVIDLLRDARAGGLRPFDIMLEAKAKDLALLRLREQIGQFAPELAGCVG